MPSETYELISLGMRYWFVLLGVVIVLRAARWALHDHRAYARTLRALPDAGLIGEIVNLETGECQPLPREGVVGSSKACDVRLTGLRKRELAYFFRDGHGVAIAPSHRHHQILLDGQPVRGQTYALHGSRLSLPGYFLRVRLFAGLNVPDLPADMRDAQGAGPMDAFSMDDLAGYGTLPPELMEQQPFDQPSYLGMQGVDTSLHQDGEHAMMDAQRTWIYAVPPPETFLQPQPWAEMPAEGQPPSTPDAQPRERTGRRSRRHEE